MKYDQAKLLDATAAKLGITSDYQLAKQWEVSTAGMSQYRSGKNRFDDYMLTRIAETLDKDPAELIALRELDKHPTGIKKTYWETLLKKSIGVAGAGLITAASIGLFTIAPSANASHRPTSPHPTNETINYTQLRIRPTRFNLWLRRLLAARAGRVRDRAH